MLNLNIEDGTMNQRVQVATRIREKSKKCIPLRVLREEQRPDPEENKSVLR